MDNHVVNQASRSHPRPTEVDVKIYSHSRLPNRYRHHRHPTTTIARLNEDRILQAYFNTQPLRGHFPNKALQAYMLEGCVFNPASHCTLR